MNSPAHDLALALATQGVGVWAGDTGWGINAAVEPTSPDTAITLFDTGGFGLDTDDLSPELPTFQVRVRAGDFPAAYTKQDDIKKLLTQNSIDCETSVFSLIVMTSNIISLGMDQNNRYVLVANYRSWRTSKE